MPLGRSVAPGETVRLAMDWHSQVPRTFARTGYRGDFYLIAHWFPKLGVFQGADGWNCHQFHSNTEFFSDYGVYRVDITLPKRFVVGATGVETASEDAGEGFVTHRYEQADVHAFTWTASPAYLEATDRFEVEGLPPVDLRLLYQPEHADQVARHFAATKATLELYGTWYGPYPYDHLTIIDPAWESGAGGMEYPTLFTAGTRLFNPMGGGDPEGVTIHECGHQFWYALVGNNETEDAWLDEGLNTFSTGRAEQERYGDEALVERYLKPPGTDWRGFLPVLFPEIHEGPLVGRMNRFRRHADWDVPATPTYLYYPGSHGDITYSKTALWLSTLERYLGWDALQEILSTFFSRYAFHHPTPDDFFAVANEVAARRFGEGSATPDAARADLTWFFDQVYRSSVTFDYQVLRADSFAFDPNEPRGFEERDGEMVYVGDSEDGEDGRGGRRRDLSLRGRRPPRRPGGLPGRRADGVRGRLRGARALGRQGALAPVRPRGAVEARLRRRRPGPGAAARSPPVEQQPHGGRRLAPGLRQVGLEVDALAPGLPRERRVLHLSKRRSGDESVSRSP